MTKNMHRFIILMYHDLESPSEPSEKTKKGDLLYVVDVENFEHQMEYLYNHGFQVITLDEILHPQLTESPNNAMTQLTNDLMPIVLTFDDGHITNYTRAFPILKKCGFRAHFFITVGWINKPHYMTIQMIRELSDYGMVIGSHGMTHRYLDDLKREEILWELKESKEVLKDITGRQIQYFSSPGGRVTDEVKTLARELGYIAICASQAGCNTIDKHSFTLNRLAIKRNVLFKNFKGMVNGKFDRTGTMKSYLTDGCKRLLGNALYEEVRETLLKIR
ncbi:MAG TPA: hypothetical protein EYP21_10560 [Syntrophaceae bacterium]|nr:hypothetical protein [Syntrophaceae bacterium]